MQHHFVKYKIFNKELTKKLIFIKEPNSSIHISHNVKNCLEFNLFYK